MPINPPLPKTRADVVAGALRKPVDLVSLLLGGALFAAGVLVGVLVR